MGNWCNRPLHLVLNSLVLAGALVIVGENDLEASVRNSNGGKPEVEHEVPVVLDQINDCQEDCVQGIVNNFLTEQAGRSNGDWVAVNHAESLLENGVLTLRGQNLLLSWVVNKM